MLGMKTFRQRFANRSSYNNMTSLETTRREEPIEMQLAEAGQPISYVDWIANPITKQRVLQPHELITVHSIRFQLTGLLFLLNRQGHPG